MNKRWMIWVLAMVAFSLLLSACQGRPSAEEIVARMKEVQASVSDAHAVVELSVAAQGMDVDAVIELWEKSPNQFRAEVLEASGGDFVGVQSVTDGERVWMYHPGENEVLVGKVGDFGMDEPLDPSQMIERADEAIQWVLDHSDVKLLGEEDLAGERTYKLAFTPKDDEQGAPPLPFDGTTTLWVAQDTWVALQAHFDGGSLGEGRMRVRSYEFNAGVPDERFSFEPPEGARVVHVDEMRPIPLTLDEALAEAEFPLQVPGYTPEGVTLVDVFRANEAYVLHYDHGATSFTVVQGALPETAQLPSGEASEVTVRGEKATLVTDRVGNAFLSWTEDGIAIAIAGRISAEEIQRVAESLQ